MNSLINFKKGGKANPSFFEAFMARLVNVVVLIHAAGVEVSRRLLQAESTS